MAIFTAIGTAIAGALFAGSTLAATLISSALAFGANLAVSYLRRPKKRSYSAVQGETQYGGDVPVQTLLGVGKVKGQRQFYAKWDKGNKWNSEVFALANGWCDGLESYVYIYGEKKSLVERAIIGNEIAHYGVEGFIHTDGGHYFSIRFYDGRPGQGVDQHLVDVTDPLGQKWKSTSVNAGICYVVVDRLYEADYFPQGKPDIEFVLRGLREYDPRKDSMVAGGSGPQRLDDPATWQHTENPAVHRLNYQLGLRAMISGRTLIGEGKSLGQLDLSSYFVAMNVCDTLRTNGKKTYECSLWVTGDDDHTEVLKEFDDAMAGYGVNRRGLSGIIPGAPQIPVLEITPDDIPADRAKEVQYRKSAFDRYNHLSGQFLSIESMWNPESLTPVYVNADVAEDGRYRQTSNDFLQVTDPDIAQYLLNIRYRQNRRGGTATLPVSRRVGFKVQEGEWVTWRGKEWMISEWVLDEQFRITLKLTETGADIYDDEDIEPGPVVIPPVPPINPSLLSTVQNFDIEVTTVEGADGYKAPALRFLWDAPDDPTITQVRIEYRKDVTGEILKATCDLPESGQHVITTNVVPGVRYDARATITPVPDRLKTFTPWVTTADETADLSISIRYLDEQIRDALEQLQGWIDDDIVEQIQQNAEDILAEVQDRINAVQQQATAIQGVANSLSDEQTARVNGAIEAARRYRSVLSELGTLRDNIANNDFAQFTNVSELRRTLSQRIGDVYAEFDERITTAVNTEAATVRRVTTLETAVDDANASIIEVDLASVQRDNALAQQMSLLTAGTDNQFDPAELWLFDATTEGWTGNGTPTVSNGFLRPANQASGAYVASPSGLAIGANLYRQVRARVRRTGSPVWAAYAWWNGESDTSWSTSRRQSVSEPVFDVHGIGLITFDMSWTGTIDRIRLDLSSAQTSTDYFEFDWISIGSPSPGASRAELFEEQQARATGDSANASQIAALQAVFEGAEGSIDALADAVDVIEVNVENLEDSVGSQATALTALTTQVGGKASQTALDSLSAEVEALGGGGIVAQGEAIRAIRTQLGAFADEVMDQGFADFLGKEAVRKASADASQSLATRIDLTSDSIDIVSKAVTLVQAVLPDKAEAKAMNALTTRVTAAEGVLSSQATSITQINASLAQKASTSALSTLDGRVTTAEGTLSAQGAAITSINSDLAGKASASALASLTTRVSENEAAIESQSDALTQINSDLAGKASVSALTGLTTRVTSTENTLDLKNRVFRQNGTPTATAVGDVWINTGEGNKLYRASAVGSANWVLSDDQRIPDLVTVTTAQANSITAINSSLAGKADASALTTLTTRVTTAEGVLGTKARVFRQNGTPTATAVGDLWFKTNEGNKIYRASAAGTDNWVVSDDQRIPELVTLTTSQSSAITQINSDLAGKASATALTALTTRVTEAENTLTSQASSISSLTATVGGLTADTRFKMEVLTGPSGYARIGARARYGTSGSYRDAGWYIDVPSNSALPTQFIVDVDRFSVLSGSDKTPPFVFEDGVLKLAVAHVVRIVSGEIEIGKTLINSNGITVSS